MQMLPVAVLLLAFALDRWIGEPPARWHPVVWMGQWLSFTGAHVAPACCGAGSGRGRPGAGDAVVFLRGMLAWCAGAALVAVVALAVQWAAGQLPPWSAAILLAVALKPLFAWRMLRDETAAVEQALATSLAAGRERLARLVSRDVSRLDATAVRESAIESLAENLNDSVVAPVFWFVLLGLPGAALYRFANTADAMWGYRGVRAGRVWEWAGKFAARADDVLSWLPARITGGLLLLLRPGIGVRALATEARRTPSPNSGWPMAAMALALRVRLAKPGVYVLNAPARAPQPADAAGAQALAARAVVLLLVFATGVLAWT